MGLYSATINEKGKTVLSSGQILNNVHQDGDCLGDHCPLHNPSEHSYRDLPLGFNGIFMYRETKNGDIVVDPDDYELNVNGFVVMKNSAKCLNCNDVVVSETVHDFTTCSCGNVSVDGGLKYIRRAVKDSTKYEDLSICFEK